jgi:hypothetical protein
MSDYDEIRNLIARYALYADDWQFEKQATLFMPDGVLIEGGRELAMHSTNITLAKSYVQAMLEEPQPSGFKHLQCNSAIDIDGDHATALSDLLSLRLSSEKGWSIGSGRYADVFVRVNGHWLFKSRTVTFYRDLGLDPTDLSRSVALEKLITAARAEHQEVA